VFGLALIQEIPINKSFSFVIVVAARANAAAILFQIQTHLAPALACWPQAEYCCLCCVLVEPQFCEEQMMLAPPACTVIRRTCAIIFTRESMHVIIYK
jgi:hypothetical protein